MSRAGALRFSSTAAMPDSLRKLCEAQGKGANREQATKPDAKPNKYHNHPTTVDGIRFDSRKEARYYEQLKIRKQLGEVAYFLMQVPLRLPGGSKYVVDFLVFFAAPATPPRVRRREGQGDAGVSAEEARGRAPLPDQDSLRMSALPALRYHGAKYRLAKWLLPFFPPHALYVEPFGGAAGVLLNKPRVYAEVYNDLDGDVVNYFRVLRDPVLRDPVLREQLIEAVTFTPYARTEFEDAREPSTDPVERARRIAVRAQMGFGSAGATKNMTGFRIDTKRKHGTAQHLWARFPANIYFAGERFAGVLIENRPAIDVIKQHDGMHTLHFVDPPYMHATRKMRPGKGRAYSHEMGDGDHRDLLAVLLQAQGMVIVCGYPHDLYREALAGWQFHTTKSRISAGRGTKLKDECCWINPAAVAAMKHPRGLFSEVA